MAGKRSYNPPPIDLSQHERTTETVTAQAKCKLKKSHGQFVRDNLVL